jgi:hypothetical protein
MSVENGPALLARLRGMPSRLGARPALALVGAILRSVERRNIVPHSMQACSGCFVAISARAALAHSSEQYSIARLVKLAATVAVALGVELARAVGGT